MRSVSCLQHTKLQPEDHRIPFECWHGNRDVITARGQRHAAPQYSPRVERQCPTPLRDRTTPEIPSRPPNFQLCAPRSLLTAWIEWPKKRRWNRAQREQPTGFRFNTALQTRRIPAIGLEKVGIERARYDWKTSGKAVLTFPLNSPIENHANEHAPRIDCSQLIQPSNFSKFPQMIRCQSRVSVGLRRDDRSSFPMRLYRKLIYLVSYGVRFNELPVVKQIADPLLHGWTAGRIIWPLRQDPHC